MKFNYQLKKQATKKQTAQDVCSMAERSEIKQLFVQFTLLKELKELEDEPKDFCRDTERDIRVIMQQTADLNQKLELTAARVDQLEARVSYLDDAEIENQKTMKWVKS